MCSSDLAPKPVLSNLSLQFYPDAKIGIVGPNGTGKSTLMKIMAGRDTEFVDELPHTATGKLSKKTLRDQFRDYRFAGADDMIGRD